MLHIFIFSLTLRCELLVQIRPLEFVGWGGETTSKWFKILKSRPNLESKGSTSGVFLTL